MIPLVRIREARKKKALTMKELAQKVGVVESAISMYETGKREPDYSTLVKIADVLDVSTDFLLCRTNSFLNGDSSAVVEPAKLDSSLVSQLCAAYNLNDTARAMIETIISMSPAEREVVAGLARRFSSALNHDDDELLNRSVEQLDREKEAESKTKARA